MLAAAVVALCCSACQLDSGSQAKSTEASPSHDHSQHHHGNLEATSFGDGVPIPEVTLTATADPMGGWNLRIQTNNFRFSPKTVNEDAKPGLGHAHLYADGYKIARLYSEWYHLKALTPGKHQLKVTLNADDHSTLSLNGQPISATVNIIQP